MCDATTYRSAGAEASSQLAVIDILLLWSKDMDFGYDVGFHIRSTPPTSIGAFLLSNSC